MAVMEEGCAEWRSFLYWLLDDAAAPILMLHRMQALAAMYRVTQSLDRESPLALEADVFEAILQSKTSLRNYWASIHGKFVATHMMDHVSALQLAYRDHRKKGIHLSSQLR